MPQNQWMPETRRLFLQAITVGAGSFTLVPKCLLSSEKDLAPLTFIVVTDTHLGYRDNENAAKQWEQTAKEISQAKGNLVLHLGDIVDGRRESQYVPYLNTRDTIGKTIHEIPGNHDPADLFQKYIRKSIDVAVDHQWLKFLLLNNTDVDSHDGFLTKEQFQWLDQQCAVAAKSDMFVAICMHVPAHTNLHPDRGWYVKPENGQKELYALIDSHKDRLLCLLHGHFHNGIRGWNDSPVHEICFPSALYNQNRRLEEQKAAGYNPAEFRPGFTQVSIEDGVMRLQYQPVGEESSVTHDCKLPQLIE